MDLWFFCSHMCMCVCVYMHTLSFGERRSLNFLLSAVNPDSYIIFSVQSEKRKHLDPNLFLKKCISDNKGFS